MDLSVILMILYYMHYSHLSVKTLRDDQAGFRKERSCVDQIATLRVIVEQTIEWQTSLCMNFIDFEKAFDSIDHQVLWKILKHYGIPQKIISIIQQLNDGFSCQLVHDGNLTEPFTVTTGVRQAISSHLSYF